MDAIAFLTQTHIAIFVAVIGCVCYSLIYERYLHPLRKFPGPFWASQTHLWKAYQLFTHHMPEKLLELHDKYGPVVRYGPNDLSFQRPDAIAPIYKTGREMPKSDFYEGFTTFIPNLFGTRNEELHALRRRQMAHSFSSASLLQMEYIYNRHLGRLVQNINNKTGQDIDLKDQIAFYVYDMIGELVFDADFHAQESQDPADLPPINDHIFVGTLYGLVPSLLPYSMKIGNMLPLPGLQGLLKSRAELRQKTTECVRQALSKHEKGEHQSLLKRLIESKDPETGASLSEVEISAEAFAFLVAGSHTTSGTLTLLMFHTLHNPNVLAKVTAEICANVPKYTSDAEIISYAGLEAKLPYTTACIRENYRMSAVFAIPLPRTVTNPEGVVIDGVTVPQGTDVAILNHTLHHDASVWGPDHDKFIPERWLGDSKCNVNNLLPFGTGHRACIGRNVAHINILKVYTTLLREFEFELVDENEVLSMMNLGFSEKEGPLLVRARRRME